MANPNNNLRDGPRLTRGSTYIPTQPIPIPWNPNQNQNWNQNRRRYRYLPVSSPEENQESSDDITSLPPTPTSTEHPLMFPFSESLFDDTPTVSNQPVLSFTFQLQAHKLQRTIVVLIDADFNQTGSGYIHVDDEGFDITVHNLATDTVCLLDFWASKLTNFECRKPVDEIMVPLREIYENLNHVRVDDTVTVYSVDGSHQLSFNFQHSISSSFSVNIYNPGREIGPSFRKIELYCSAIVTKQVVRHFNEAQLVSVVIENKKAVVAVRDEETWESEYERFRVSIARGREPREIYSAWFKWRHVNAFAKAYQPLHAWFQVGICHSPKLKVACRFNLGETGHDLLIFKRALAMSTYVNEVQASED